MKTWGKGIPLAATFLWVKWFDPKWMSVPTVELAHFHPKRGLKFWSDEPDWDAEMMKATDFEYIEIKEPRDNALQP